MIGERLRILVSRDLQPAFPVSLFAAINVGSILCIYANCLGKRFKRMEQREIIVWNFHFNPHSWLRLPQKAQILQWRGTEAAVASSALQILAVSVLPLNAACGVRKGSWNIQKLTHFQWKCRFLQLRIKKQSGALRGVFVDLEPNLSLFTLTGKCWLAG